MDETDALRFRRYNEDAVSLAPSTTESIVVEGKWSGQRRDGISAVAPSYNFVLPASRLGFAGDRCFCLASDTLSLGSVSGRECEGFDLSFSH